MYFLLVLASDFKLQIKYFDLILNGTNNMNYINKLVQCRLLMDYLLSNGLLKTVCSPYTCASVRRVTKCNDMVLDRALC